MKEILAILKISSLNAMQDAVYKEITSTPKDVVVLSPTGSGKTLAYMLPIQEQIDRDDVEVQVIVLVPGRELALQSHEVLQNMKCGLRSMPCYGGRPTMDEHRRMREINPHVIFATPGRMLDHLEKGNIDATSVFTIVIDEFDKCLEMGFSREMKAILEFLSRDCRRILLSATDIEAIPHFVNMGHITRLDFIPQDQQTSDRVKSFIVKSEEKDKLPALARLISQLEGEQTIVFLNYRDAIDRTASYLEDEGFFLKRFHGGLDQRQREQSLHQFSNGSVNIMVCTDLAARGLDIPHIANIIHYHLPLAEEEYIHRVGRTARWDATGNTFFILGPEETLPSFIDLEPSEYVLTCDEVKVSLPKMVTLYIGKGKKDKLSKGDIVGFLCKMGGAKSADIGRIDIYDRYTYVAVSRKSYRQIIRQTSGAKIKGMKTVVEEIR